MHWVDRGAEPVRLSAIRARRTPVWVRHYIYGEGGRPSDHQWQLFRDCLKERFNGLCAYCEQITPGEVDHFRPKSKFPHDVYAWSNWLFSCSPCNRAKREKWPEGGYVDPCATSVLDHPKRYFDFSTRCGKIIVRTGLSQQDQGKAHRMIRDLKLNEWYHVKERKKWIEVLDVLPAPLPPRLLEKIQNFTRDSAPLSSLTKVW